MASVAGNDRVVIELWLVRRGGGWGSSIGRHFCTISMTSMSCYRVKNHTSHLL